VFLVDKQIASARAEYVKWDTCQGRPMVRCPSVPVEYLCIFLLIIEHLFFQILIFPQQHSSGMVC